MSATLRFPDRVKDAPATARLVYAVLEADGPLTRQDLVDRTGAACRSVTAALATLREAGLVTADQDPTDRRRRLYRLSSS
jgi:DNA-binding MarR family transcriptional regulator